jgi:hypothetical protein
MEQVNRGIVISRQGASSFTKITSEPITVGIFMEDGALQKITKVFLIPRYYKTLALTCKVGNV